MDELDSSLGLQQSSFYILLWDYNSLVFTFFFDVCEERGDEAPHRRTGE